MQRMMRFGQELPNHISHHGWIQSHPSTRMTIFPDVNYLWNIGNHSLWPKMWNFTITNDLVIWPRILSRFITLNIYIWIATWFLYISWLHRVSIIHRLRFPKFVSEWNYTFCIKSNNNYIAQTIINMARERLRNQLETRVFHQSLLSSGL